MEALDEPYTTIPFLRMVKKRATWLIILFLGEMLTATAMQGYNSEIERAAILAMFLPLIISSGGNSGSQATTLVIRAMALGELRLRDWFRVVRKELLSGLSLGLILGTIGFFRITLWQYLHVFDYGKYHWLVALTVGAALVGVVLWGTLSGAMLPFLLRRCGLDPNGVLGAIRRHARGRDWLGHLLQHGVVNSPRDAPIITFLIAGAML